MLILNNQQLINIASRLGNSMQKNGAETYRIEDSLARVLSALGATNISVFAINSCIMVSMSSNDSPVVTEIRRCTEKGTDLYKIDKLNTLCRKICSGNLNYNEIIAEIDNIEAQKPYSFAVKLLGFTMVSVGFSYLFGGALLEILAAFIVSLLVYPIICIFERFKTGIFFKNIIASAATAFFTLLFSYLISGIMVDIVIIGVFMNLVPGVALASSIRDIIAGDLISGKNTLTEAVIIALGMALGAGIILASIPYAI